MKVDARGGLEASLGVFNEDQEYGLLESECTEYMDLGTNHQMITQIIGKKLI